jgi:acyl-CoA synthetase (AMP-forming)/AMP-acid ligase II
VITREVSEQQIVEFCGTRLAHYKLPKKVIFAEAIPRKPKGIVSDNGGHAVALLWRM